MKRIKLLTPLLTAVALSSSVGICSCSCNKQEQQTTYIPFDLLNIDGKTLKGLKPEVKDISKYDTLLVPDSIERIQFDAFKDVLANSSIKTLVLKKNLRFIGSNAFENATSLETIDISDFDIDTLVYLKIEKDAFKNLPILGQVKFNDNYSEKQKKQMQDILTSVGVPLTWFASPTEGHVTASKKEYEAITDVSCVRLELTEEIDPQSYEIVADVIKTGGTEGVDISVKKVFLEKDNKTLRIDTQLESDEELKDGDYVTYKLVLTCKKKDNTVIWVQVLADYKVTYKVSEQAKVLSSSSILEDGKLNYELTKPDIDIEYSYDGVDWTKISQGEGSLDVSAGDKIYFKGFNPDVTYGERLFSFKDITTKFVMGGKAMSLYNDGGNHPEVTMPECAFVQLFKDCTGLIGVDEDFLDSTEINTACYYEMFRGCSNLTNIPKLPSTKLPYNAYNGMFQDCTSLTDASIELPALELDQFCYGGMFNGCANLVKGPTIMATTIVENCFNAMFLGCEKLTSIKLMYSGEINSDSFFNWVKGVTANGTLYYNGPTTTHSSDAIPTNWVVKTF